jgi:hypothetical protein
VSIRLTPEGDRFWVELTPPQAEAWRSQAPLTPTELIQALRNRGCHSADITNALQAAGPEWGARRDAAGEEWSWVLDSDGAVRVSRAVFVAAGIAAAITVAILLAVLVRGRAVPGVGRLLWLGIPILLAGFAWCIPVLLGRQRRERESSHSWWFRAGKGDSRIVFFEGLPRRLANALSVVAVFCGAIALSGFPFIISGTPASPSRLCHYRLVSHAEYTCVSHSRYVSAGAGEQRLVAGFLGACFVVQFGIAAAELRRRRRRLAGVELDSLQT